MKKSLFTAFVVGLCMSANVMAQVPNYVPTNGLVGWWPFNGNAQDESGNGNNGTVNGATLTADRFGVANKAYSFDGLDDFILAQNYVISGSNSRTYSIWFNTVGSNFLQILTDEGGTVCGSGFAILFTNSNIIRFDNTCSPKDFNHNQNIYDSDWHNLILLFDNTLGNNLSSVSCYLDGIEINNITTFGSYPIFTGNSVPLTIGKSRISNDQFFNGKIDDIGIWNRALTECEIQDLYHSQLGSFSNTNVSVNPTSSSIGSNATLTVSSPLYSLQWQSNPGNMGWNNVVDNGKYNGAANDTLVVSNLQLSNHNQPFRVLACGDTSNIATIQIADTCITNVTVYDTLYTTVTDTLIINTTLSLPAPNNENTILIYPNPASDHITIDYGNYAIMNGYQLRIENSLGQQVFQTAISQQSSYLDLSTWGGNGIYYVHIIDPQSNTIDIRKIVLQ
jgi:hypothetical protein